MFSLNDILAILDHWPTWKKIKSSPELIDAMEIRIAELEKRLARCPGDGCPRCGELSYRTASSQPHPDLLGTTVRTMKCEKCDYTERKIVLPKA
jgi:hypothetical protein